MTMTDWARRELAAYSKLPYPMTDAMFRLYTATMDEYDSGAAFQIAGPGVVELVRRLMNSEPLTALDGGDDEWMDVSYEADVELKQNTRCPDVFLERRGNGPAIAYRLDRIVWTDRPRGDAGFTGWDSARRITFPYEPWKDRPRRRWKLWRLPIRLKARLLGELRP